MIPPNGTIVPYDARLKGVFDFITPSFRAQKAQSENILQLWASSLRYPPKVRLSGKKVSQKTIISHITLACGEN